VAVTVATSHRRLVVEAALALVLEPAGCLGHAGTAGSLFVAALPGGVLAASVILHRLRFARAGGLTMRTPLDFEKARARPRLPLVTQLGCP
jgi:hypothetical protein